MIKIHGFHSVLCLILEPNVSLLQRSPDSDIKCHVTGFYSNITVIQWRKNGQDINDPALIESGDNLPNDDGTFQRTVTLRVSPDDWKKNQYSCVVEHMEKTIQKVQAKEEYKSNYSILAIIVVNIYWFLWPNTGTDDRFVICPLLLFSGLFS